MCLCAFIITGTFFFFILKRSHKEDAVIDRMFLLLLPDVCLPGNIIVKIVALFSTIAIFYLTSFSDPFISLSIVDTGDKGKAQCCLSVNRAYSSLGHEDIKLAPTNCQKEARHIYVADLLNKFCVI